MSQYSIPNQQQYNTPNTQRILHQNTIDSKVYLSRTSNTILKAIGNDLVLNNLKIKDIQYPTIDTVKVILSTGLLIQDLTLIQIDEEVELDINVRPFDNNNGYLIIYTDYQYINSVNENNLKFKLNYITADGNNIINDTWDPNRYRIILYRFSFRKLPTARITQIYEPEFEIFNKIYYLQGINNYTNFSERIEDHAVDGSTYGYSTTTKAGHVRVGEHLTIDEGTLSVVEASETEAGVTRFANETEALLLESSNLALTPKSLRNMILNLKNIEIQITDPGVSLGTALILS